MSARPLPLLQRSAVWLAYGALGLLALKLVETASVYSLWIDELIVLSAAYKPIDPVLWLLWLSSPADPHFPTHYILTRVLSGALHFKGQPVELFLRLPSILLSVLALGAALFWAMADRRRLTGPLLGLLAIALLLADPTWPLWALWARMYGPMTVLALAMVIAIANARVTAASLIGLFIALLHPFGAIAGFAPVLVLWLAPVLKRAGIALPVSQTAARRLRIAGAVTLVLVLGWSAIKLMLAQSQGFGLVGGENAVWRILRPLSLPALAASATAVGAALFIATRMSRKNIIDSEVYRKILHALMTYAVLLSTILLAAAALILAKPSFDQAGDHYLPWINPALYLMAAASVGLVVDAWRQVRRPSPRQGAEIALLLATFGVAAWVLVGLRGTAFGVGADTGFRAAAGYLNAAVDDDGAAVTFDTFEMFNYPSFYRTGLACPRGGQIIPYLSEANRSRVPCQGPDGRVIIGDRIERVYFVHEQLAWTGSRQVVLDGFTLTRRTIFGGTAVEEYARAPASH